VKAGLPFERVAILDPSHVFSRPESPEWDRQKAGELRDWLAKAKRNGADACYARIYSLPREAGLPILEALQGEIQVLVPATYYDAELECTAYHHTANSAGLLPPGPYLQGVSCHGLPALETAEWQGFDYAFLSPVFSTESHPGLPSLGLAALQEACAVVQIPVIALGGVDHGNAGECMAAGAAGWAGIRAFMK
jgi:hypothetical protein